MGVVWLSNVGIGGGFFCEIGSSRFTLMVTERNGSAYTNISFITFGNNGYSRGLFGDGIRFRWRVNGIIEWLFFITYRVYGVS